MRLFVLALLLMSSRVWAQGPPYQTDDPVPVEYGHFEFYVFGNADGTPKETDSSGPAIEFNWGASPRIQLHVVVPLGSIHPADEPSAFGLVDAETGIKWAWIREGKYVPQIGTFPMFELPLGDSSKGLGIGKVWYRVPVWAQKNIGPWTLDGGAGETFVPQEGYRNFPYGGFLLKREIVQNKLELGGEIFAHGAEGEAAPQERASTMIDVGGYYHFKSLDHQLLFCYGHSVAGMTENYGYLGLYWTWGTDKAKGGADRPLAFAPPRLPSGGLTTF
jgi:hypothetical protein